MTISESGSPQDVEHSAPKPKPGPARPGPGSMRPVPGSMRPGPGSMRPGPGAAAPATAAVVSAVPANDPHRFGRVDPDGTVWLVTSSGERTIGSWQAGDTEAAYEHFGRRFDDLHTEVILLEQRLASGSGDARKIRSAASTLAEGLPTAHVLGDVDSLATRLQAIVEHADTATQEEKARRDEARAEQTARKEALAAEAEELASTSVQWKSAGDRMRAILDEWKTITGVDRKTDDALWKRFSHARTAFDKHRRAHFAELDAQRGEAAARKEKLIAEAEELSTSTDWGPTARRYRDLMTEWKSAGRARRDVEDQLWARFRAAQDVFFAARSGVFSARDADLAVNLETKRALLVEAEALLPVTDSRAARTALRSIHERWEKAGHVPRGDRDAVEGRLRTVDEAVRTSEEREWKRTNPEARARAEATVAQLRTSIAGLEAEAEQAAAAGQEAKASNAREAAEARREWLAEAERTLAEFS